MKQMKLFLVALLTVVMGVSVTSCMNGENNPIQPLNTFVRYDGYSAFKMADGTKLVPKDNSSTILLSAGMYIINSQYNQDEVVANSPVAIDLLSTPVKIDGPSVTEQEITPDAALFALNYQGAYPLFFDETTLIIPCLMWAKGSTSAEVAEDAKKHILTLSYEAIEEGATELVLHLTDQITSNKEDKRTVLNVEYKAYDLSSAISRFGGKLKKIIIKAKVNSQSNKVDDETYTKDDKYEIDYSKIAK